MMVDDTDKALLAAIQGGLPLVSHPYAAIATTIGVDEEEVLSRIQRLRHEGVIRRFGIIVHHRPLGYQANGMVVWKLAPEEIEPFALQASSRDYVTLCYQRTALPPRWPYTLYTMIHGQDRETVLQHVATLAQLAPEGTDHQVLFSSRRFKQQGARYFKRTPGLPTVITGSLGGEQEQTALSIKTS